MSRSTFFAHMRARAAWVVVVAFFVIALASTSAYAGYFSERIVRNVRIGSVDVGGLTRDAAVERLQIALDTFHVEDVKLIIEGSEELIQLDAIGFDLNLAESVERAFRIGHEDRLVGDVWRRVSGLWREQSVDAAVRVDESALRANISMVAGATDVELQDIRLSVNKTSVALLADTKPGRAINESEAEQKIRTQISSLQLGAIELSLHDVVPSTDPATGQSAVAAAQKFISRSILLQYEDLQFYISRERIGSWTISAYEGAALQAGLDREKIAAYVTTIASAINIAPEPPRITTQDGRVTGFEIPKVGRAVEEDALVQMIIDTITSRAGTDKLGDTILVPVKSAKMAVIGLNETSGIVELIGRATTPFTGSPKNRISNIKNGVKFLSGVVVPAGEEFSTLGSLGTIDNTTGYLPELVIKGDRTIPEFGGGLCQVSTTLFRSVMDAGLPVTARRNHSYRVSYYEKDGNGKVIGPGLDATIYEPDVDFKFRNDMATPVLIIGYVIGDKITFELYGTKDGRTSSIVGPKMLTETSPGEPVYIDEPTLAVGVKKQVETPHPGGSAIATYHVTYANGEKVTTEFKSWYRRWPAKYLVGTGGATPMPVSPPIPSVLPTP